MIIAANKAYDYKMLLLTGNSPVGSGRGYTGIADPFGGSFVYNPAGLAGEVSSSTSIHYGSLTGSYAYPSLIGVYPNRFFKGGFEYSSLNYFDSDTIDTHILRFAAAQSLNDDYDVGISLNYYYLNRLSPASYFSITVGGIYHVDYEYSVTRSIGLYDINAGIIITPGFFVEGEDAADEYTSLSTWGVGYSFTFYRDRNISLKWFQEAAVLSDYFQLPFKNGIEAQLFQDYYLRAGMILPDAYGFGNVTMGAGYAISSETFTGSIDYSLVHRQKDSFVHYAGVSFSFSSSIRRRNDIRLQPRRYYFSPNGDGVHDSMIINTQEYDNIKEWTFTIHSVDEKTVRTMTYKTINKGTIFEKVLSKESSFQLPEQFVWDGKDDDGETVPDGDYVAYLTIITNNGSTIEQRTPVLTVDTVASRAELSINKTMISPQTDSVTIRQTVTTDTDPTALWTATITNTSTDKVVLTEEWKNGELPEKFEWAGLDDNGNPVSDGIYTYTLRSEDRAGNTYSTSIDNIMMVTGLIKIDAYTGSKYYGPDDRRIVFITDIPQREMVNRSTIIILTQPDGREIARIDNPHSSQYVEYEALDQLDDGAYTYYMKVNYTTGDNPESARQIFYVDRKRPEVLVRVSPETYQNTTASLSVSADVTDTSGVRFWEMRLLYDGVLLSRNSGDGNMPDTVEMRIMQNSGITYEPYTRFTLELDIRDNAGNILEESIFLPEVGIRKDDEPLILRIPLAVPAAADDDRLQYYERLIREYYAASIRRLTVDIYSNDDITAKIIEERLEKMPPEGSVTVRRHNLDGDTEEPHMHVYAAE